MSTDPELQATAHTNTILIHPLEPVITEDHVNSLVSSIKRHRASRSTSAAKDSDGVKPNSAWDWLIVNRYYSASVRFKLAGTAKLASKLAGEHEKRGEESLVDPMDGEEPALLVVVPRTSAPPSSLVAPLLAQYTRRDPEFDVALLISVAVPSHGQQGQQEQVYLDEDAWDDFAIEHGFEWIDIPSPWSAPEAEPSTQDGGDEEDKGIGRIVEALHAHMWEDMTRNSPAKLSSPSRQVEREGDIANAGGGGKAMPVDENDDDDLSLLGAPPLPSPRPFIPVPVSFPSTFLPFLNRPHAGSSTASRNPALAATPNAFDDDFAPFVPPLPSGTTEFPALLHTESSPSSSMINDTSSIPDHDSALYRHPELAFPDSFALEPSAGATDSTLRLHPLFASDDHSHHAALSGDSLSGDSGEESEGALEAQDLSDLFEKLKGFRAEAQGLGLEERRALAEKVVLGLLGE